jgi:hypothetical protein
MYQPPGPDACTECEQSKVSCDARWYVLDAPCCSDCAHEIRGAE